MNNLSLFDQIGADTFLKANINYGLFDTIALSATYNFSYNDFIYESRNLQPNKPLPETQKTVIHETTHLYQTLSTSYGMYWYSVRQFQSDTVRWIIRLLLEKYSVAIRLPLFVLCGNLRPAGQYQEIIQLLTGWLIAELVTDHFESNFEKIEKLLQCCPILQSRSVSDCFQLLEIYLAKFFQSTGRSCSIKPLFTNVTEEDLLYEMQHIGLKAVGYTDVVGIMETWAKVAEYWGQRNCPLDNFPELFPTTIDPNLVNYYEILRHFRDALPAKTLNEFILSYMAACEIALSPPILPFYQHLRPANFKLRDMNPIERMFQILGVLKNISPIRELKTDYSLFTETICSKLNWPTPTAIAKETVKTFRFPQEDCLSEAYYQAQLYRSKVPYIFLDLDIWFKPQNEYIQDFAKYFTHPIITFTDNQLRHPNHHTVFYFTMQRLMNLYLRALLISNDQSIVFPYKTSEEELIIYGELIETILEKACGIRPKVRILNPN